MKKRIIGLMTALGIIVSVASITPLARADDPDPTYRVTVTRGSPESREYTAHVTLGNIAATYGTFGLKYDKEIFDFDPGGVTLADGLELKYTPPELVKEDMSDGYYVFVWQAGGYDDTVYDTTETPKDIADLKFTLKSGATADDITLESITVMPWQKTREAKAFAASLPPNGPIKDTDAYFSVYWRWTDEANDVPERGRLTKDKAAIHGIDRRGFYEAAVNVNIDNNLGELSYFCDVKTVIDYGFDVKNSAILFHVIDKETGEDIEDADVSLYRNGEDKGAKSTDYMGEAAFPTDIDESAEYSYQVAKDGYLPVPLAGAELPAVTTKAGESTLVTVELERGYKLKGYVDLGQGTAVSGAVQSGASVTLTRADGVTSTVLTSADRNDAEFEATLPKGIWDITVMKAGYVQYVITDYEFTPAADAGETIFGLKDDGEVKKITPYIGSAKTGTSVSLIDAAVIKAEMREGAEQIRGDVDDNGRVDAADMAYVLFNYGKRTVRETYGAFLTSPQPEKP